MPRIMQADYTRTAHQEQARPARDPSDPDHLRSQLDSGIIHAIWYPVPERKANDNSRGSWPAVQMQLDAPVAMSLYTRVALLLCERRR